MSKVLLIIFLLSTIAYPQTNAWRGIVPLKSTRADVEKLDQVKFSGECFPGYLGCEYSTETEIVSIQYTNGKCGDVWVRWDVPPDTVLRITVSDREKNGKSPEELNLNENDFKFTNDDIRTRYWINAADGIIYVFNAYNSLERISYIPKLSDNALRCDGFPDYNPVSYAPINTVSRKNKNDIAAHIDAAYIRVTNGGINGGIVYLIYYSGKDTTETELKKSIREDNKFAFGRRKYDPNLIKFIEGGRREKFEVDVYILPKDWQPPTPQPSYPSPQFMRNKN